MAGVPELFSRQKYRSRRAQSRVEPGFLHQEMRWRLVERLFDIKRQFERVLVLGGDDGELATNIMAHPSIRSCVRLNDRHLACDVISELDRLPFVDSSFDALISGMALHWLNDLPGFLTQARRLLRDDGLLLIAMPGGGTLQELRYALTQAEIEIAGGASVRVPPFVDVRDAGALLQRAGFVLPVADCQRLNLRYRVLPALLGELRAMGETNPMKDAPSRLSPVLLERTFEIYADLYHDENGHYQVTIDFIFMTGWRPDANQPKPLRPNSATKRLADALHRPPTA